MYRSLVVIPRALIEKFLFGSRIIDGLPLALLVMGVFAVAPHSTNMMFSFLLLALEIPSPS